MLKNYDISLVRGNERKQLQEFIDEHWKKNHVLAISRELLDWQHYNREKPHSRLGYRGPDEFIKTKILVSFSRKHETLACDLGCVET